MESDTQKGHFKGKDALGHMAEVQAQGIAFSSEVHGQELPGQWTAGLDAARDTAIFSALLFLLLPAGSLFTAASAAVSFAIWKMGRSAWLGWNRLERLHRLVAQEKWEIEHNRGQEREELCELYAAKGFEGKLLEDVVDVLMADGDRLLKVMVEEELRLSLESQEHPLMQGGGAFLGAFSAAFAILAAGYFIGVAGAVFSSLLVVGISSAADAAYLGNRSIPAFVWSVGTAVLSIGIVYFLIVS